MSYDSEQKAAKKAREQAASEIETDLRQVQSLHTDALTYIAQVFCAITNPPEYGNIWRSAWTHAQDIHQRSFEMLNRCADAVSPIAVHYPKLQREVKEALYSLQLLTNCIRAITLQESREPASRKTESPPNPKSKPPRPDPAALTILRSMSATELRKALDTAADLSIGHAVVLLQYVINAEMYHRLERLPKLSADAKGVELVPGIYLQLGTAKLTQSRIAFAVRYLEVIGDLQTPKDRPRPKLPKKWMEGLSGDVNGVDHEELLHRVGAL